jgi:hypothetical protein
MRPVATVPLNTPPELLRLAEDMLATVARVRFVSIASLMAYGGPDGLTPDLIDVWCKTGLLERGLVHPDPLRPEQIQYVSLTTAGARALYAATGRHVEGITPARLRRSSQKRMHDTLCGEVALSAISLAKDGAIELVGVETDDRKLATVVHVAEPGKEPERIVLQPDALIVTRGTRGSEALLVEVDRGTTAPKRMQTRYRGHLAWHAEGGPLRDFGTRSLRVLTLVPTQARLERLHAAALEASGGRRTGFLLFGLLDDYTVFTRERWLERSARPVGDDASRRVPLLAPTPGARAA